jgi:hypothetical protein
VAVAVCNIVLDPILMFTCGMGIAGAGVATAASQALGAALYVWALTVQRPELQLLNALRLPTWVEVRPLRRRRTEPERALPASNSHADGRRSLTLNPGCGVQLRPLCASSAHLLMRNVSVMLTWMLAASLTARLGTAASAAHQIATQVGWPTPSLQLMVTRFAASLRTHNSPQRKEAQTTVSRSDTRFIQRFDSSAHGLVRRWRLIGYFPIHVLPPLCITGTHMFITSGTSTVMIQHHLHHVDGSTPTAPHCL